MTKISSKVHKKSLPSTIMITKKREEKGKGKGKRIRKKTVTSGRSIKKRDYRESILTGNFRKYLME